MRKNAYLRLRKNKPFEFIFNNWERRYKSMNDLTILHLSDLHIDVSGATYSRLLKKLLDDIKDEMQYVRNNSVIVVITGDILHQGPLASKTDQAIKNALSFFKDLYDILLGKVVYIYVVPGNHDKYRTKENEFLVSAYRSMAEEYDNIKESKKESKFDNNFYDNFWKFHINAYTKANGTGYLELVNEIYKIFGLSKESETKSFITDTFGVDIIEVLGKKYCFVLLNTAWSCMDDNDNRNLILGKFQIDKIKNQFRNLMDIYSEQERPGITIVLGHHPLGALRGKEEDNIFTEMISFESLDANIYLCGHTHDRTVNNWINNRHSISTFVTGIGWPENKSGQHVGSHTYSMYVFNLEANSVDVYVRSTNDGGSFSPDFRIYTNYVEADAKKIVFPIRAQEAQTYLPLSVGGIHSPKAYYISKNFMEYVKEYIKQIAQIGSVAEKLMENDKNSLFDDIDIEDENNDIDVEDNGIDEVLYNYLFANVNNEIDEDTIEYIKHRFQKNEELLFNMFFGFLVQLCQKMQEIFVGECGDNEIVRFHFRFLADKATMSYYRLCTSFPEKISQEDYDVSEIKYGELIEESYKNGKSLIYSVNEEFAKNKLKNKWTNFITVVPLFEQNHYSKKKKNLISKFPFITFGVTINNEKYDKLLYCMDYFGFKETLEEIIEEYLQLFFVDINRFCSWAKKIFVEEK